jgi:hypothetical protein
MGQNREQRDMGRGRNEAETGEPIQLNEKDKDQRAGQHQAGQQGGQQQQGGGQHQGGGQQGGGQQPNRPQAKPDDKQQKPA